jgi:hypothetical protein
MHRSATHSARLTSGDGVGMQAPGPAAGGGVHGVAEGDKARGEAAGRTAKRAVSNEPVNLEVEWTVAVGKASKHW